MGDKNEKLRTRGTIFFFQVEVILYFCGYKISVKKNKKRVNLCLRGKQITIAFFKLPYFETF